MLNLPLGVKPRIADSKQTFQEARCLCAWMCSNNKGGKCCMLFLRYFCGKFSHLFSESRLQSAQSSQLLMSSVWAWCFLCLADYSSNSIFHTLISLHSVLPKLDCLPLVVGKILAHRCQTQGIDLRVLANHRSSHSEWTRRMQCHFARPLHFQLFNRFQVNVCK